MNSQKIDLYSYFNVKKEDKAEGFLTLYTHTPNSRESEDRMRPAMLIVAGGGYEYTSPREKEAVALYYLGLGYNAFVLEYSCAPFAFPTSLIESCLAMLYIKQNAKELHVDSEHVCAIGFSAGAHLVATLSSMYNSKEAVAVLGKKVSLCKPNAVILSYPVVTNGEYAHKGSFKFISGGKEEVAQRLSMENAVTNDMPPAFIWTTVGDTSVPSENAMLLAWAYKKANVPFEFHMFERGDHGLSLATTETGYDFPSVAQWKTLANVWLENRGFTIKN